MSDPVPGPAASSPRWPRIVLAALWVAVLGGLATVLPLIVSGSLTGVVLSRWVRRRQWGARDRLEQYVSAARAGRLPDGADPAVWRPLLEAELRRRRRARVGVVPLGLVVAAVGMAITADLSDPGPAGRVLATVGGVLVVAAMWGMVRAQVPPVERLLDQVSDPGTPES
ncbi:hypothetical protein SAMN05428965_1888 [Geodermatophilus sp. DSM 45219]|nr:hypothetical protein SAMN05428965_1888 [Geodermatophilus sp. DSM 45219]